MLRRTRCATKKGDAYGLAGGQPASPDEPFPAIDRGRSRCQKARFGARSSETPEENDPMRDGLIKGLILIGALVVSLLAAEAVAARVVFAMARAGELGRYAAVGEGPGFSRAAARALAELRLAQVDAKKLRAASTTRSTSSSPTSM